MDNLRNIVIKSGIHNKPFMFQKYSEINGEDGWEKIGDTYTLKGAYDLVRNNPKDFEFVCNGDVESEFSLEKKKRTYTAVSHARDNYKRTA